MSDEYAGAAAPEPPAVEASTPPTPATPPPTAPGRSQIWDWVHELKAEALDASPEERPAIEAQLAELKTYLAVPADRQSAPPPVLPERPPAPFAPSPVSAEDWLRRSDEARAARVAQRQAEANRLSEYRKSRGVPPGVLRPDPGRPAVEVQREEEAARAGRKEASRREFTRSIEDSKRRGTLGKL